MSTSPALSSAACLCHGCPLCHHPPCRSHPWTGSPEHTTATVHMAGWASVPWHQCLSVPCLCSCFDEALPSSVPPQGMALLTYSHTTTCHTLSHSLSRTAGMGCLALEQMPAALSGHGLAMVPSTRPAQGCQVNVNLFLSAPPWGGCFFHLDELMHLHFPSHWGARLISLKFTFPASRSHPPQG